MSKDNRHYPPGTWVVVCSYAKNSLIHCCPAYSIGHVFRVDSTNAENQTTGEVCHYPEGKSGVYYHYLREAMEHEIPEEFRKKLPLYEIF